VRQLRKQQHEQELQSVQLFDALPQRQLTI